MPSIKRDTTRWTATDASEIADANELLPGWISQTNERGTLDIIWSCSATLFVCVWVMLHLNVPAPSDSWLTVLCRKARWVVIALFAPELLMLFACGQWASAKRSVRDMKELGHDDWTMIHAFYADSGGFLLDTPDYPAFPITAKQLLYLTRAGYTSLPPITKREIWDKSKADKFAKVLATLQTGWFVVQVTTRGIQGLPISLLELTTLSLITCSAATFHFWFHKPLNVEIPTRISVKATISRILVEAGHDAETPFRDTPLDFAEPLVYTSSQLPFHKYWGVQERPLPRIPNDRDSHLHDLFTVIIVAIPTAAFGTFHLIAWNFVFPSAFEQAMWRWTCVSMGVVLGLGCFAEAGSIIWNGYTTTGLTNLNGYKLKWPWNILFFIPGFLYVSARIIVLVEVVLSLRALPAGCYQVVNWLQLVPHI